MHIGKFILLNAKKLLFILIALLWITHPCLAASTDAKSKTAMHTTHKKNKHHHASTHHKHHTKKHKKVGRAQQRADVDLDNLPEKMEETLTQTEDLSPEVPANYMIQAEPTPGFTASIKQRLVDFVENSVSTLRYSAYKLGGTHFDASQGIYIVDCSGYVDNTLHEVYPNAYSSLVSWSGSEKPNSEHYYDFFKDLSANSDEYWSKVEDIEKLQPGDILVFRYKNSHGSSSGGHVMVVMDKPVRDDDAYVVSVADSAPAGHSQDTRPASYSGIGIGKLLLKVNPKTGKPSAYAWRVGSRWNRNVNFAMARPTDAQSNT